VGTGHGAEQLYCDALRQADCKGLPFFCPFYRAAGGECVPPSQRCPHGLCGVCGGGPLLYGSRAPLLPPADVGTSLCHIPPPRELPAVPKRLCPGVSWEGPPRRDPLGGTWGGAHAARTPLPPALLGVNLWPEEPAPRFLLCPDWAFCEFLPCPAEEEPRTVLLGELWEGREYGLVLTARPGEYRCPLAAAVPGGATCPRPAPGRGPRRDPPACAGAASGRC